MTLKGHFALCFKTRASIGAHYENLNEDSVRNFPFPTRIVCRTGVSDDDFWQAAKTGDGRPCRPVLPTHSKSDCAA